ncbi:DUF4131 domain-containing protein [Paraflavitalea speifideaquila]|uniref:DUF4131 domain-containing protein n=1 Tax=Paraflavitalea speifideaquila TaxID=3076558 RepID=UPI0028EE40D4|nr:DUF4131 domain-containing protein [Paraflavitalea speifideiaquila]
MAWITVLACSAGLVLFSRFSLPTKFRLRLINGLLLNTLLLATGYLLSWYKDIRHQQQWFSHHYTPADTLLATIEEPLQEKSKDIHYHRHPASHYQRTTGPSVKGRILLYFQKNSQPPHLQYGNQIMFIKTPEPISNTANPAAFNYEQYCAFKNIFHQVYLRKHEYITAEKCSITP